MELPVARRPAASDAVEAAFGDLKASIQDIPDDASLAEALANVKNAAMVMLSEIVQITTTTCSDS